MEPAILIILGVLVGCAIGFAIAYYYIQRRNRIARGAATADAERILADAATKQREMILEAKDEALRIRTSAEEEIRQQRQLLQQTDRRIQTKEETLDHKIQIVEQRERLLYEREAAINALRADVHEMIAQQSRELERIAGLSSEAARQIVMRQVEDEVRQDAIRRLREIEREIKDDVDQRARELIVTAIQRCAADQVSETSVSVVPLPNDEMKGRIIGREGRNIRALENATGVELIIDDTPDAVTISCFDPLRREVARLALEKLILDGRIHPTRIEEAVNKARAELDQIIVEEGEQAALKAGIHSLHPELIKVMGRLKFRTSYGQNVLLHSIECANIGAMLAAEIGANVELTRRACFLHDIGKALDHQIEGPHAVIGANLVRQWSKLPEVVHAIAAHHYDEEPRTIEALLVQAADTISGARPGARREMVETYVQRLEKLESIANSFNGVERSFAVQAGREIRILVKPNEIDDLGSMRLARDIVKKIQDNLDYPGQIKVVVLRETRAIDYAK